MTTFWLLLDYCYYLWANSFIQLFQISAAMMDSNFHLDAVEFRSPQESRLKQGKKINWNFINVTECKKVAFYVKYWQEKMSMSCNA